MPQDLLYSKTHEWVRLSDDKQTAAVGLTAYALELLTDLVHVELPEVGRKLKAEEPFGEIESVKAVSDLYSPVDGEVVEVNQTLADNLEKLADDPYGNGWFIKVKLADQSALTNLLDEAAYIKQCEEEH
ncbi:MAG: glycine cleavage system protein GcvH [Pirellulales bacterium]|nr:glycine cleavage system protein GcvH [Pirellulales bacterium]